MKPKFVLHFKAESTMVVVPLTYNGVEIRDRAYRAVSSFIDREKKCSGPTFDMATTIEVDDIRNPTLKLVKIQVC